MFNPFVKLLCAAVLANAVLAQNIFIARPAPNTNVDPGSNVTVQLDKPVSLLGSAEVALVIGYTLCISKCPDIAEDLGIILFSGPYEPKLYPDSEYAYENITVTIPSTYNGPIQLGVARFYLRGPSSSPQLQLLNVTLYAVSPSV